MIESLLTVCLGLLILFLVIVNVFIFKVLKMVTDEFMKAERSSSENDRYC